MASSLAFHETSVVLFFQFSLVKAFQFNCFYCLPLKIVQEVEMGETPLRNSQLQAVLGAGIAARFILFRYVFNSDTAFSPKSDCVSFFSR
jgi:hypothetical protein